MDSSLKKLESSIALYPDFPKKGILFRDCMSMIKEPELSSILLDVVKQRISHLMIDYVIGIETRGLVLANMIATSIKKPYRQVRKKGKQPGEMYRIEYDLEYGTDCLELGKQEIKPGACCLIVDDLIATGGTMKATIDLVGLAGAKVAACLVIVELKDLNGKEKLGGCPLLKLFSY